MLLSMDALFGLPRKKSAGISFRDPIHGHVFFGQQERVDEHVATASLTHKKGSKVCASENINQLCQVCVANYRCAVTFLQGIVLDHHVDTTL